MAKRSFARVDTVKYEMFLHRLWAREKVIRQSFFLGGMAGQFVNSLRPTAFQAFPKPHLWFSGAACR